MKKLILLALLMSVLAWGAEAQDSGISFVGSKEWKKIVRKAKKEKKLIFVDCYTSWCGPCKMLARDVFTLDSVGDYFNRTFINAKMDMEKDLDGVMLKKRYEVKAFPTLLFIDPGTGEWVHRMVGAGDPAWLLAGARQANDPLKNLSALTRRYTEGERGEKFMSDYLIALSGAYMGSELAEAAEDYLGKLDIGQLAQKNNWEMVKLYLHDPLTGPLRKVMVGRERLGRQLGREEVDRKLSQSIDQGVQALTRWRPEGNQPFDEDRNVRFIEYLRHVDFETAPAALARLYTAGYVRKADFRGLLDKMKEVSAYNLFRNNAWNAYFMENMEALKACSDKSLVEEGIRWIGEECAATPDEFTKADLMSLKARLQEHIGDAAGAVKSRELEQKYAAEGMKKNGGKVVRAFRMN